MGGYCLHGSWTVHAFKPFYDVIIHVAVYFFSAVLYILLSSGFRKGPSFETC